MPSLEENQSGQRCSKLVGSYRAEAAQQPTRWNFAPWADFRSYMDLSLARALDRLRETSHSIDPATPVGIEGTQMPHAFGGYDLWRLSQVLDWVSHTTLRERARSLGRLCRAAQS